MPESYFLESFVGGLKPIIKSFMRKFKPQNLYTAMETARLQEDNIHALKTPPDRGPKPSGMYNSKPLLPTPNFANKTNMLPGTNSKGVNTSSNWQKPTKFILAAVRAEKMAKGLCYYCDQPFDKGHKCGSKTTQVFLVEVPGEDEQDIEDTHVLWGDRL